MLFTVEKCNKKVKTDVFRGENAKSTIRTLCKGYKVTRKLRLMSLEVKIQ